MKKLKKINLSSFHEMSEMSENEMKNIIGGSGYMSQSDIDYCCSLLAIHRHNYLDYGALQGLGYGIRQCDKAGFFDVPPNEDGVYLLPCSAY